MRKGEELAGIYSFIRRLNLDHPKRWQSVLSNNLNYHRTIHSN